MTIRLKPVLLFSMILLLMSTACEKVVYIPIEAGDQKIVLSSLICPDSTVVVHVSRSVQVGIVDTAYWNQPEPDSMIVDEVSLYEEDQFIGNLQHFRDYFFGLPGFIPTPGRTYRLEAASGEMKPVTATTVIPKAILINSFDTTMIYEGPLPRAIRVRMQISDPGTENNYYAIMGAATGRYYDYRLEAFTDSLVTTYFGVRLMQSTDGGLDIDFLDVNNPVYLDNKLFFSDELFNGKDFDMSFEIGKYYWYSRPDTVHYSIEIQQVEKSYFLYAKSEQKYRQTRDNPFVEPVQVYTNVKNGLGLFSAYHGTRREFVVDWTR